MKKISPFRQSICFVILLVAIVTGCKKTETIYIRVQEPVASFSTQIIEPYGNFRNTSTITFIDSNFYFLNTSDTGATITYHWDFGDGATSTEKNPTHSYAKRGEYNVTLKVSNDNKSFDTLQQTLRVILGQQHISLGDFTNISPIAIEETAAKEFVLLATTGYGNGYNLFLLDSLLKQKTMKTFPAAYRLSSMKATKDGNYIFTGSTDAAINNNELIKMAPDGSVLWKKILPSTDSYIHATPTPDGGYAVVGSRLVTIPGVISNYNTVVIKTDANGNQQWQKLLDAEGMILTENSVAEQDGLIISGTKRGACSECDSIMIIKLDNAGNVLWKNSVLGGLNTFVWWNTSVSKLTNGNYAVSNGYTRGIFIFSASGEFLDRKLAPSQVRAVTNSTDGNMIVLQSESGNGNRMAISKLTLAGSQPWTAYPEGRQKLQGGITSCCSSSWPAAISPLSNGGTISIGYRMIYTPNTYNSHQVIALLQLDDAGKQK